MSPDSRVGVLVRKINIRVGHEGSLDPNLRGTRSPVLLNDPCLGRGPVSGT